MNHPLYARWRQRVGPVTTHVEPGKITLRDGTVLTTGLFSQPLGDNALAYALRISQFGEVIGVRGRLNGVKVGSVQPGYYSHADRAVRPNGEPVPRCVIVPDDDVAVQPNLGNLTIEGDTPTLGGIEDLTVAGCVIENRRFWINDPVNPRWGSSKQNVLVEQHIQTGALRILFNKFGSEEPGLWQTYGVMWTCRLHGQIAEVEVSHNECAEALEHACVYWDNAGFANSGAVHKIIGNVVTGRGGGRTCIQVTNRAISGTSGGGRVVIEDNKLRCIGGGGGAAITIACHTGPVRMVNNDIECDGDHSGVAVWTDTGKGPLYLTPSGHPTGPVLIRGMRVFGGNRPHVAISGAERVRIEQSFRLEQGNGDGPRTCIDLDNSTFGGPINNGPVSFINCTEPMSGYSGFASGAKVKRDDSVLSAAQIDAMMVGQ